MFFADYMQQFNWRIILDVSLVAILCYQIMNILRGTRAVQVLIGIIFIFIAYAISGYLELNTLNWIISKFYSSIIVVMIVLFQDDLRRLLTRVGRGPFIQGMDRDLGVQAIDEAINAARTLSHERAGAIVVFERGIGLDRLYDHSVKLDSLVSEQILLSIFQSFSPLHDGAVIIQKGRLSCASAQLPLSKNPNFSKKLGTRHSAAVGISEETDAVVLVVSEETGNISVAWDGQMQRQPNADVTRRLLMNLLVPQTKQKESGWSKTVSPIKKAWWRLINPAPQKQKAKEFSDNNRRAAWGEKKSSGEDEARGTKTARQMTSSGTISIPGGEAQRWSMSLRLPRHQSPKAATKDETSIDAQPNVLPIPDDLADELIEDISEENLSESKKAEHRFDPPLPPEPPPRDVTVGGVSLDPPLDTSKQSSTDSESKNSESPAEELSEESERKRVK
jgi:diadenylate cyclase